MLFFYAASKPKEEHIKVNNKTPHMGRSLFALSAYFPPKIQTGQSAFFHHFAKPAKDICTSFKFTQPLQICLMYMWVGEEQHFNSISKNCFVLKYPNAFSMLSPFNTLTLYS